MIRAALAVVSSLLLTTSACIAVCPPELHAEGSAAATVTPATFAEIKHDSFVKRAAGGVLQLEGRMWCGIELQNLAPVDDPDFHFEESVRVYSRDRAISTALCRCRGRRLRLTGRFTPNAGRALGSLDVTDLECRP